MAAAALLAVTVASVGGVFAWLVAEEDLVAPPGFDTPKYVWRANLVAGEGLNALEGSSPYREHADRPGYPVFAALVRATTGITAFDLGFALPAVIGVVVGLAAGALAVRVLGEPRWAFAVYGFLVGASLNVVLTASGLTDNLLLDGVILAAAAGALLVSAGERAVTMTLIPVAAGALIHWPLTAVFVAVVAALAVVTIPSSVAGLRRGEPLAGTAAARLALVAAASAGMIGAALVLLSVPLQPPRTSLRSFLRKLGRFVPRYHLPVLGTTAALGIPALAVPRQPVRRRGLALLVLWGLTAAVAVPALVVFEREIPAHRLLGFALGIPLLAAAAVTGAGRLLAMVPPRAVGAVLATAVVLAAAGLAFRLDRQSWQDRARVKFPVDGVVQAGAAGRWLSEGGNRRPIIFVVNPPVGRPAQATTVSFGVLRSALPPDQVALAHVYVGRPAELEAGRPSRQGDRSFRKTSLRHFTVIRPLLDRDPVVLLLAAFNSTLPEADRPSGDLLAPGVTVLRGPPVTGIEQLPPPPVPPSVAEVVARALPVLGLLWLVGLGWSFGLVPGGVLARAALAPALGLSIVVLAGTVAGRLSFDTPGAGPWLAGVAALLGWAVPGARWLRRHRPGHADVPDHAGAAGPQGP